MIEQKKTDTSILAGKSHFFHVIDEMFSHNNDVSIVVWLWLSGGDTDNDLSQVQPLD